jgi:hypothetical protein
MLAMVAALPLTCKIISNGMDNREYQNSFHAKSPITYIFKIAC